VKVLTGDDWRGHDFAGESVAVLAPTERAARIVPHLVRTARSVKVFQQEPAWMLPVPLPLVDSRLARLHLRLSVKDAWTRRLLTPDRRFGRRGVVVSRRYYRALQAPNCKLIDWPVYAVLADGVRTAEGVEHRVDCLIRIEQAKEVTA
jgi:cation diffusion facilitator CzcD-associated flavoprotein CzcO